MFKRTCFILSFVTLTSVFALALPALAQTSAQPDELQAVYACKSIASAEDRLACYDRSVGRFEAAEKRGELVTVSKKAIEKVERDAFGFNIPSLPSLGNIFGSKNKTPESKEKTNALTAPVAQPETQKSDIKEAEVKPRPSSPTPPPAKPIKPEASKITKVNLDIRKTTEFGHKKTRFFMANGQVWEQTDGNKVRVPKVRNGTPNTANISKASLGSFFLRVNGKGTAIRVRRVR